MNIVIQPIINKIKLILIIRINNILDHKWEKLKDYHLKIFGKVNNILNLDLTVHNMLNILNSVNGFNKLLKTVNLNKVMINLLIKNSLQLIVLIKKKIWNYFYQINLLLNMWNHKALKLKKKKNKNHRKQVKKINNKK